MSQLINGFRFDMPVCASRKERNAWHRKGVYGALQPVSMLRRPMCGPKGNYQHNDPTPDRNFSRR